MPRDSKARPSGRSATRHLIPLAAVAVLAVLAVGLPPLLLGPSVEHARSEAETTATLLAGSLAERIAEDRARLEALAAHFELAEAIAQDDLAMLGRLAGIYRSAFPNALRLMIVPGPQLNPAPGENPPIGYALVELAERAAERGRALLEVHYPGQPQAHINMVAPVADGGRVVGSLVLSLPLTVLDAALSPPAGARVALTQEVGATSAEVFATGAADGNLAVTVPIADTPWRLTYITGAGAGTASGPLVPGIAIALAVAAILAAAVIAIRGLGRELLSDADVLARLARGEQTPAPRLLELNDAASAIRAQMQPPPDTAEPAPRPASDTTEPAAANPSAEGLELVELPADEGEPEAAPPERAAAVDPSILRAYDVRGVVGQTLTAEVVRRLGQAIGSEAAAHDQTAVVVGHDGRHSSPELAAALTEGLMAAGRQVIDIGRVPTPVVYFASHHLGTRAGVMVTGSHNPPQYNGLKIVIDGETLSGEAIQALGRRIATGNLATGEGRASRREVLADYIERITGDVTLHRPLKVVLDCGNGVTGVVAPELFEALGCEVETLYGEVDGDFPNHHPDPTVPENLEALIHYVRLQRADVGLAFDGDGDRLGVVDDRGNIIWADRQLMLFARDVLAREPGSDIVFDVKCSSLLAGLITENAGVPVMWKTGHSLIKQKLAATGAPLAGEMSGHIFFNDRWYGFDDGLYAGARLLELLSLEARAASEVFAELPQGVNTPEIRVDLAEGEPPRVVHRLLSEAADDFDDARLTTTDGLRLDFPDGWGLVRASNTQPCLVLRFEGRDQAALARIQALFRERLQAARPGIELPF